MLELRALRTNIMIIRIVLRNHHRHYPIETIIPNDACRFRFRQVHLQTSHGRDL